jgi:cytochrome c oxidase subunit IV
MQKSSINKLMRRLGMYLKVIGVLMLLATAAAYVTNHIGVGGVAGLIMASILIFRVEDVSRIRNDRRNGSSRAG